MTPSLQIQPASARRFDRENDGTISTKIAACGLPLEKSLFPLVGDSLLHFHLVGELGAGAFSRVFLATQRDLAGRLVALKVSEREDGEPQRLARLQHTNIVPIYSVHHHFQFQVVCMPYVGAHTLAAVLKQHRAGAHSTGRQLIDTLLQKSPSAPTTPDRPDDSPILSAPPLVEAKSPNLELLKRLSLVDAVLWIAARLADGLAHAHERGILHCDLKPQNVLLADDGQPMLLDFNMAMDSTSGSTGHFGGTVPYMAPEHLQAVIASRTGVAPSGDSVTAIHGRGCGAKDCPIDARADLYSLGVILYHLLAGRDPHNLAADRPPDEPTHLLALRQQLPEPPGLWNPQVTPAVDAIVLKLLAPNPADRYQSAADLRDDLERHLANRPLRHAPNTSPVERARKWRRRHPRLAVGLATAAAVLGLLVLPASTVAVVQDQRAKRELALHSVEALVQQSNALTQVHNAQVLLSTQTGNREFLDEGFRLGRSALAEYGVGEDADWQNRPAFRLLPTDRQRQLRGEFGELALLLARCEKLRATPDEQEASRAALAWNKAAEACFPPDERPTWLGRQRAELLGIAPPAGGGSSLDAYHDGLQAALRGQYGEALTKLEPFTQQHPDHFMAWFVRGVAHEGVGQFADAAAAFTVCAALKPEMPWPYFNRGLVRLHQQRYPAAEEDFADALRLKPNWTSALINRALARKGRQDWTGAEADLTAALAQPDAPTRVYFIRAIVRRAAGDKAGGDADAAEGLKRTPADCVSWVTRGVWRMKTDAQAAMADFDEALTLNPRSRDALQNKAVVYADLLAQPRKAVEVMDALLEMYPTYVEATAARGVYLARAGDAAAARRDCAACLRDEPTAYRYYQMAGLHAQLARHEPDGPARREAFRLLALALRTGFGDLALMATDSDLDPVRDSDEFRALVAHAKALQRP